MLGEGVRRAARGERLGERQAHVAGRLDEQARRKVLRDRLRVEAADGLERLAREHGVGAAVDDAVARGLGHLDGAVEVVLLVGDGVLRVEAVLEHVRVVEALRRLEQTELDLLVGGEAGVAALGVDEVGDGLHEEAALHDHVGVERHHKGCARAGHGGVEVAGLGALVIGTVEVTDAHALGQGTHLGAAVVVAEPHVHLGGVGIFQVLAAVDGLGEQVVGLVIGCDEDVDVRILLGRACGQWTGAHAGDVAEVHE